MMMKFSRREQWREAGGFWKGKNSNHRKTEQGGVAIFSH